MARPKQGSRPSKPAKGGEAASALRLILLALGLVIFLALSAYLRKFIFPGLRAVVIPVQPTRYGEDLHCNVPKGFSVSCRVPVCGRVVDDFVVTRDEVTTLENFSGKIMEGAEGAGGPTIYDLHSGALSQGKQFVDIYSTLKNRGAPSPVTAEDRRRVVGIVGRLRALVATSFKVDPDSLELVSPTFFSRIKGNATALTLNDEYWHDHVDRVAYGAFDFTCLVYLSDKGVEFDGGEFVFVDEGGHTTTVHPARGRVVTFTSGHENVHHVNRVTRGTRLALTLAFTCNKERAINDFMGRAVF